MGGQLAPDAPAQPTASKVKPSPGGTAAPDPEQALLELTLPAASPLPVTPAAQAAAEALEAVALEEGYRAGSLMVGARLSAANAAAVAAARAGQELPATLLDATAGEQLPVTPASAVHGRAASVPGQTAAALRAAGAAMKVQQMAQAEEAAQAAAATAAAQRDWERVRQPVQVTLAHTLMTAARALRQLLWDLADMPRGTQPKSCCLTITTCLAHHCSPDMSPHSVQQRGQCQGCCRSKQTAAPLKAFTLQALQRIAAASVESWLSLESCRCAGGRSPQPGHRPGLQASHAAGSAQ